MEPFCTGGGAVPRRWSLHVNWTEKSQSPLDQFVVVVVQCMTRVRLLYFNDVHVVVFFSSPLRTTTSKEINCLMNYQNK